MLRSLEPQESALARIVCDGRWDEAVSRSRSHPNEARPTEAGLFRGVGSTVLSAAVRRGAPTDAVRALLEANAHQVAVFHRNRGSVLHDALKHRASDGALELLFEAIVDYQKTVVTNMSAARSSSSSRVDHLQDGARMSKTVGEAQFQRVQIQDTRYLNCPNLLAVPDDMGRLALHYLVERAKRQIGNGTPADATVRVIRKLVAKHPESCKAEDSDGNTPLVLLLLAPAVTGPEGEGVIHEIAGLILSAYPEAATLARKAPQPWRFQALADRRFTNGEGRHPAAASSAPTPLHYALLNGRSIETVELILDSNRRLGLTGSAAVVTRHGETPAHVAVTARAPVRVCSSVVADHPQALLVRDVHGLTPVDWMWFRHVADWHAVPVDFEPSRVISRRRFLANPFLEWHDVASRNIPLMADTSSSSSLSVDVATIRALQEDLLKRAKLLLPAAAAVLAGEQSATGQQAEEEGDGEAEAEPWSLLHAACYVPCPIALVRVALKLDGEGAASLRARDARCGRTPLHYAAGRMGYQADVPVGASRLVRRIRERPPALEVLALYPEACRIADDSRQLPLHIAIDAAKRHRAELAASCEDNDDEEEEEFQRRKQSASSVAARVGSKAGSSVSPSLLPSLRCDKLEALEQLLASYPGALDRSDGKTGLLPWQQAAVGPHASETTIFSLLRANPSALVTKTTAVTTAAEATASSHVTAEAAAHEQQLRPPRAANS